MARFLRRELPHWWRKGAPIFLAFFYFSGLLAGAAVGHAAGDSLLSLMRSALQGPVSIVSLLCVTCFPLLISAFAVFISQPQLLLVVSFGKAFAFSFVGLGIMRAFGQAGWLIRWLLCFSEGAFLPLLYWYWLRHISGERRFCGWEAALVFCLGLLIGSVDHCVAAPFLARLIDF